ncbi:MAG: hypothetical protein HOQ22_12105 [Nocardioidaceae bacterium]|nr:hypothetical protein [Nocardioidaceae bacterium]NUS51765.1 hypothetical protein [Nocardioidaceae bacterium]
MTSPQPSLEGPGGPLAGRPPAPLVVAVSVAGLEALLLVLFGLAELRSLHGARVAMGITTTLFFVVYGLGLAYCAWQLRRMQSWARAPVVLAQLIQLGVAWSFRGGASTVAAVALAVLAVVVLAGVFHPASLSALADDEEE